MASSQSPTYDYVQLQNQGRSSRSTEALLGPLHHSMRAAPPSLIGAAQPRAASASRAQIPMGFDGAVTPSAMLLENLRIAFSYATSTDDKVKRDSRFSTMMTTLLQEGEGYLRKMERDMQQSEEDAQRLREINSMLTKEVNVLTKKYKEEKSELRRALEKIQELEARGKDNILLSKLEKQDLVMRACITRHRPERGSC